MRELVQSYLSRYFEIATSEIGNDGIYLKSDTRRHRAPWYGEKLLKELKTIFALNEDALVFYINEWAFSVKKYVDLLFYWSDVGPNKMALPSGRLFYLDIVYTGMSMPIPDALVKYVND